MKYLNPIQWVDGLLTSYDVQKDSILEIYLHIYKYLRDNPLPSDDELKSIVEDYFERHPVTKGDDGGYYIPSVSDGTLSFAPSDDKMPPVPSAYIKGADGINGGYYRPSVTDGTLSFSPTDPRMPAVPPAYIKGADGINGGYYIPSVSDGTLSFSPTDSRMPAVTPAYIKGDKGDTGERGATGAKGDTGERGATGADGENGGYYTPSISDGVLSFTASKSGMPTLPTYDIQTDIPVKSWNSNPMLVNKGLTMLDGIPAVYQIAGKSGLYYSFEIDTAWSAFIIEGVANSTDSPLLVGTQRSGKFLMVTVYNPTIGNITLNNISIMVYSTGSQYIRFSGAFQFAGAN